MLGSSIDTHCFGQQKAVFMEESRMYRIQSRLNLPMRLISYSDVDIMTSNVIRRFARALLHIPRYAVAITTPDAI